ncbi:hypothetical protein OnM2_094059, partial [Erysiphe neolycopersici]
MPGFRAFYIPISMEHIPLDMQLPTLSRSSHKSWEQGIPIEILINPVQGISRRESSLG